MSFGRLQKEEDLAYSVELRRKEGAIRKRAIEQIRKKRSGSKVPRGDGPPSEGRTGQDMRTHSVF